jgi:hypothetical protein
MGTLDLRHSTGSFILWSSLESNYGFSVLVGSVDLTHPLGNTPTWRGFPPDTPTLHPSSLMQRRSIH